MRNSYAAITVSIILASCASTSSNLNYVPPKITDQQNELSIDEPFSAVWDRLVSRLASSFFVINNIEKESRIINVSFSSQSPEKYVDCGASTRTSTIDNNTETFTYKVAEDSVFRMAFNYGEYNNLAGTSTVRRRTSLDGRVNIYVAPENNVNSKISANARFVLTVSTDGESVGRNAFGRINTRAAIPPSSANVTFSTKEPGQTDWGDPTQSMLVTCRSRGLLEGDILNMARH